MSPKPDDTAAEAARLEGLYREKARAEIAAAEALVRGADAVASHGDELADVLVVSGSPDAAERDARSAVGGPAGEAIGKALDALELPKERFFACSRPVKASAEAFAARLRLLVEALDARVIVALDGDAAADLAAAFGEPTPAFGTEVSLLGRIAVAVDGFAASLDDPAAKRRVWKQMQALKRG
jgi:hypothetical protein